jgi:hypothetical protein
MNKRRTDNTMTKRRTDNKITKRTDNTMTKRRRTDNTMTKRRRTDNTMNKRRRTKGQTMIYKTLHRKLKMNQHEPYEKPELTSGTPNGLAVPALHVTPT